ncbi:hypothetical protein DB30_04388 [Enhygromyxa salina]|uniref:Uncharacterized protein n=1 Tax=Enhygromyxa salina TaxID=215803 RepID=A0A0C2D440_9BACT|nr:hypothetical protein [Enhygromyxa salina]KIG16475.1 hypothetical protein DB30_04388 [Enhygromyxa salina]
MSNPLPDRHDPLVALIDRHWRPEARSAGDFVTAVRWSRRRSRREDAASLIALAAAVLLLVLRSSGSPASEAANVWLDGTSLSATTSVYEGEFAGLQRMFLGGEQR